MSIKWQIGFASKAGGKQDANAALIAACNPKATTELLDALKARDAEIERLRGALNLAVDHIDMSALRISHCKDAAAIDQARATGGEKANG